MRKWFLWVLVIFMFISVFPKIGFADSPVTSTDFYNAYMDIQMVKKANNIGFVNQEIAQYLSNQNNPIDVKAAVINALGWSTDGKNLANEFTEFIYKKPVSQINLDELSGSDLFCIGYLTCLSDYFNPQKALDILEMANKKISDSLTVSVITSIVKAQLYMRENWYKVWKVYDEVINNNFLQNDLRFEALNIINNYMSAYSKYLGLEPSVISLKVGETKIAKIQGGSGSFYVSKPIIIINSELLYAGAQIPDGAYLSPDAKADISVIGDTLYVKAINPGVLLVTVSGGGKEPVNVPIQIIPISSDLEVPEDINKDNIVNMADLILIAKSFGCTSFDINYDLICDLNGDGSVNMSDVVMIAKKFDFTY